MLKKKITPTILAILLLLSMLGGCWSTGGGQSVPTNTDSLPTTTKPTTMPTTVPQTTRYDPLAVPAGITDRHIENFYYRARIQQSEDTQLCYFGAFDDTYAVMVRDKATPYEPTWETVNGLTFYYPDGNFILWENDHRDDLPGGHLWEMFNRQLITEEQLQEIYDNYYSAYPELLPLAQAVETFGTDDMEAISQALLQLTGEEVDWDDVNTKPYVYNPRLVYYCTIMDAHIFRWIPYYHNGFLEYPSLTVGPYTLRHEEYMLLYVYIGEELLTLNDAYDQGIFTDSQLKAIIRYHVTCNSW